VCRHRSSGFRRSGLEDAARLVVDQSIEIKTDVATQITWPALVTEPEDTGARSGSCSARWPPRSARRWTECPCRPEQRARQVHCRLKTADVHQDQVLRNTVPPGCGDIVNQLVPAPVNRHPLLKSCLALVPSWRLHVQCVVDNGTEMRQPAPRIADHAVVEMSGLPVREVQDFVIELSSRPVAGCAEFPAAPINTSRSPTIRLPPFVIVPESVLVAPPVPTGSPAPQERRPVPRRRPACRPPVVPAIWRNCTRAIQRQRVGLGQDLCPLHRELQTGERRAGVEA